MTDRLTALFESKQKQTKYAPVEKLSHPDESVSDVVLPPGHDIFHSLQKHGLVKLPEKSGWSDFTGKFWSTKYTKAIGRGNVYVQLPDSILHDTPDVSNVEKEEKVAEKVKEEDAQEIEAQIQYKGLYRLNSVEKVSIVLKDGGKTAVSEFETKPATVKGHEAPHGKGILEFTVEKRDGEKISGSYKLSHPVDVGRFELQKGMTHGEQCKIM